MNKRKKEFIIVPVTVRVAPSVPRRVSKQKHTGLSNLEPKLLILSIMH